MTQQPILPLPILVDDEESIFEDLEDTTFHVTMGVQGKTTNLGTRTFLDFCLSQNQNKSYVTNLSSWINQWVELTGVVFLDKGGKIIANPEWDNELLMWLRKRLKNERKKAKEAKHSMGTVKAKADPIKEDHKPTPSAAIPAPDKTTAEKQSASKKRKAQIQTTVSSHLNIPNAPKFAKVGGTLTKKRVSKPIVWENSLAKENISVMEVSIQAQKKKVG